MSSVNVNIRMDREDRDRFKAFCEGLGMSVSTAMNIFVKKTLRERRIPFDVGYESCNSDTLDAITEAEEMMKDPTAYKSYRDVHQMFEEVLNE